MENQSAAVGTRCRCALAAQFAVDFGKTLKMVSMRASIAGSMPRASCGQRRLQQFGDEGAGRQILRQTPHMPRPRSPPPSRSPRLDLPVRFAGEQPAATMRRLYAFSALVPVGRLGSGLPRSHRALLCQPSVYGMLALAGIAQTIGDRLEPRRHRRWKRRPALGIPQMLICGRLGPLFESQDLRRVFRRWVRHLVGS